MPNTYGSCNDNNKSRGAGNSCSSSSKECSSSGRGSISSGRSRGVGSSSSIKECNSSSGSNGQTTVTMEGLHGLDVSALAPYRYAIRILNSNYA